MRKSELIQATFLKFIVEINCSSRTICEALKKKKSNIFKCYDMISIISLINAVLNVIMSLQMNETRTHVMLQVFVNNLH